MIEQTQTIYQFLNGSTAALCAVAGLFFLKFWRATADRLFALFAGAFLLMGFERLTLAFEAQPNESRPFVYLLRLVAFLMILAAVIDKNRQQSPNNTQSNA